MGHLFVFRLGSNDFGKVGKELISTKMVKKKKKKKETFHAMCCAKCFPMVYGLSRPLPYPGGSCLTLPILQMRKVKL